MISVKISKYIYHLAKKIGLTVYPIVADSGAKAPFGVYERQLFENNESKDGNSVARFAVKVITLNYQQSLDLIQLLIDNAIPETIEGYEITDIEISDGGEDWNESYFIQTIYLNISYNEYND